MGATTAQAGQVACGQALCQRHQETELTLRTQWPSSFGSPATSAATEEEE